jgi:hypothetical protein
MRLLRSLGRPREVATSSFAELYHVIVHFPRPSSTLISFSTEAKPPREIQCEIPPDFCQCVESRNFVVTKFHKSSVTLESQPFMKFPRTRGRFHYVQVHITLGLFQECTKHGEGTEKRVFPNQGGKSSYLCHMITLLGPFRSFLILMCLPRTRGQRSTIHLHT